MQQRLEKEWELSIDPDTVRLFILKAKALSAAVNEDYDDGAEHEVEFDGDTHDNHHHDGLVEEASEDLTEEEFRELINDLKRKNFAAGESFDDALACSSELPAPPLPLSAVWPLIDVSVQVSTPP